MHGEYENLVVTLLVMRGFSDSPGASRACAYFRDPTAVSRLNARAITIGVKKWWYQPGIFVVLNIRTFLTNLLFQRDLTTSPMSLE